MSTFIRCGKFNLVGVMGIGLQLAALVLFNRWTSGHYLYASAAAIEITLLHNFVWHSHYTWRDRRDRTTRLRQFVRFHLSNGLVSLLGNLALMRLLVHQARLPLHISNLIAILCCSMVNFCLGNNWAFAKARNAETSRKSEVPRPRYLYSLTLPFLFLHMTEAMAHAQSTTAYPDPYTQGFGTDCAYANIFAGPAASAGGNITRSTFTGGVTFGQYFARTLGKGINASPQFELGIVGPLPGGYPLDGLASFDLMFANRVPHQSLYPFLTGGYTRMFATGNAVNFGLGIDFGKNEEKRLVRIELRDYYLFTGPQQHVVGLRIGFGRFIPD
ncbi:MAG TPA: GtrA family protein [Granulicella sp.]|jgi:putative flippase GtrA